MSEMNSSTDAELVSAIGCGDELALAEAYDRYCGAVFGLAWRILQRKETAEDLVQEVFLRLWCRPEQFDPDRGNLRPYLLAQAHGRAVDLVRSDSSRARREERWGGAESADSYDVETEIVANDLGQPVRTALQALTPGERRAIGLAYFGGLTYIEVARILGEPEGTVKSRIRSGLQRLRTELERTRERDQ